MTEIEIEDMTTNMGREEVMAMLEEMDTVDITKLFLLKVHLSAEGSPLNLDLSDTNGKDGEDGENAFSPRYGRDYSENVNRDINAPDGGNGGVGGNGGDGGKGCSLSVYYTNIADLRKMFICATGGVRWMGSPWWSDNKRL